MARIKLQLPEKFNFKTLVKVRIADINYGNHMANHVYLEFMQEARMQYFMHFGYSEKDLAGVSVIMGDCAIVYKKECFYGDEIMIEVAATDFGTRSFDLVYKFIRVSDNLVVCEAKTGMVCYNYEIGKTVNIPIEFLQKTQN